MGGGELIDTGTSGKGGKRFDLRRRNMIFSSSGDLIPVRKKRSLSEDRDADAMLKSIVDGDDQAKRHKAAEGKVSEVDQMLARIRRVSPSVETEESVSLPFDAESSDTVEDVLSIVKSDELLIKRTKERYAEKSFAPKIYKKRDLLAKMQKYYHLVPKILSGKVGSYYYGVLKDFSENSAQDSIQAWEFQKLPLDLLSCGWIGRKRSLYIKTQVFLKFHDLLHRHHAQDRVLRFFGIDNFLIYAMVPELLSYFTKDEFALSSLDKAVDLMEFTQDYGLYIMDKIDAQEQDYDSDLEDDDDIQSTKKKLMISTETKFDNVVADIFGDLDSEDDDHHEDDDL